jgi:heme O synthase-like polyprenyltransferase
MPLDDRERQILADIEAHLREDSRFTRAVGTAAVTLAARRQLKLAVAGFVLGVFLLLGIAAHIAWGLAGFAIMLASAVYGGTMLKRLRQQNAVPGASGQLRGGVRRYLNGHPPRE